MSTPMEEIVGSIWVEYLRRSSVDVAEHLGATALDAEVVSTRIREHLTVQVSASELLAAPTLADQVAQVNRELFESLPEEYHRRLLTHLEANLPYRSDDNLGVRLRRLTREQRARLERILLNELSNLPARPPGTRATSFLVAPASPSAPFLFCLHQPRVWTHLARQLAPRVSTCAILVAGERSASRTGSWLAFAEIDSLAGLYLAEIRRRQPHGPYLLAGYCVGGRIAFEVAHRLLRAGEQVPLLALLDCLLPGYKSRRPLRWIADRLRRVMQPGRAAAEQNLARLDEHRPKARLETDPTVARKLLRSFDREAATRYAPSSYPGKLVLLRADDRTRLAAGDVIDPFLGWRHVARGGLDVHGVPGNHISLLKPPHIERVAELVRGYLPARETLISG